MRTFAVMKEKVKIYMLLIGVLCTWSAAAQEQRDSANKSAAQEQRDSVSEVGDSIEISLLTCEPHDEAYSMYGHTALLVNDIRKKFRYTVNYGVFDFDSSGFIWRFILGQTDYEMGMFLMTDFMSEYEKRGSGVIEQKLNLTPHERTMIYEAMRENYREENRKYRYNFFYDNCTTRARNLVTDHLDGLVVWPEDSTETEQPTWREMVHRYNAGSPWLRFGIDLLLGWEADRPTTRIERQFLPFQLLNDFNHTMVERNDSTVTPLVGENRVILENASGHTDTDAIVRGGDASPLSGGPFTPFWCLTLLSVLIIAVTWWEWRSGKVLWGVDALLMTVTGLVGLIPTVMLFSDHPTVSKNLQILLFNPLPLLFLWPVVRSRRRGRCHLWWRLRAVLPVLFLIGALWQHYAEGLIPLATALFVRCVMIGKMSDKNSNKAEDSKNMYRKREKVGKNV